MISINLVPWREQKIVFYKRQFWTMLGVSVGFIVLVWYIWSQSLNSTVNLKQAENILLKNEIAVLDSRLKAISNLKKEKAALLDRISYIQSLHDNRSNTVSLMSSLAEATPEGIVLVHLTREAETILVEGTAESNSQVAQFMRNIEAITMLQAPVLSVIQADDPEASTIEFTLKAEQTSKGEGTQKNI